MAEWSKAIDLKSILFGGGGSNPSVVVFWPIRFFLGGTPPPIFDRAFAFLINRPLQILLFPFVIKVNSYFQNMG